MKPLKVTVTSQSAQFAHSLQARTHVITSDVPASLKGSDTGATPHELFLLSIGACTAMTIEMTAQVIGAALTKVTVTVTESTIDDPDQPGTSIPYIVEDVELEGNNITAAQLARLQAAAKKCPVYKLAMGKKVIDANLKVTSPAPAASAAPAPAPADKV